LTIVSIAGLFSCNSKYERDNFDFVNFMEENGDDVAEYLQDNWGIDSAFVFHMGFFKAREWKSIFPEEMQTIFVGNDRYNEAEYLEEKGFDVNAPLFVVYFSKLKKMEGNLIDEAGINPGSYLTEYSKEGVDAAHQNYESANYSYEDRLYYMAYATVVDGEFKLLMCCDSEEYNDKIAFPLYYDIIGKNEKFYPYTIGGGAIRHYKHRNGSYGPYSKARLDFSKFIKTEGVALFAPKTKRKSISSDFETLFLGCRKVDSATIKSLDYFYMLYNGEDVKSEIEKKVASERNKINQKIRGILGQLDPYLSDFNYKFPENQVKSEVYDRYYNNDKDYTDKELAEILSKCKELYGTIQIAQKLDKQITSVFVSEPNMESVKWSALQELKQTLKRGFLMNDLQICKDESMSDYSLRLKNIETNFDKILQQRIKELN
jgi:hypothetical protein